MDRKKMPLDTGFPHPLIEDAATLASYQGWSEEVYRDLLALQTGDLTRQQFGDKYYWEKAILVLDMTGFTQTTIRDGELTGLLRIVDAHKVCLPVLRDSGANLIRSFADDLVALFDEPENAVSAAFDIHQRVRDFHDSTGSDSPHAKCCIGIGYGKVLKIGPNLAQGAEMNRASKLGEDIAGGEQTLVTDSVFHAVKHLRHIVLRDASEKGALFPYYQATPAN